MSEIESTPENMEVVKERGRFFLPGPSITLLTFAQALTGLCNLFSLLMHAKSSFVYRLEAPKAVRTARASSRLRAAFDSKHTISIL